jgi:hypothetical protein
MNDKPLTFAELRLASMLSRDVPHDPTRADFMHLLGLERVEGLDTLREILADLVIQADRFAAERDIDLAAAIRARFVFPASLTNHET